MQLGHSFSFLIEPVPPFDFDLTVHKPARWSLFTPTERYERGAMWTATDLGGRLAGVKLVSKGTTSRPKIAVRVFVSRRPTREQVREMKDTLSRALGARDDLTDFYAMAERDAVLRHVTRHLRGMHDTSSPTVYPDACLAIMLQMAPLKRSNEMMAAFIGHYGAIAEFDGQRLRAWPTPERVATLHASELARKCKLGYRARYVVAIARMLAKQRFPSTAELDAMTAEEAKRRLLSLPGIGDYSADIINPHGGFPIDVWSVEVFGKLFYGKTLPHDLKSIERVKREGLKRWGRWAWMAFYYVVQDLPHLSRALGIELRLT